MNEQNYVAEYALHDYPITEADITEKGQKAWDDMLNTINVCKFNLGWGAIGLCTHALYESIDHAANRNVYGKFVTDFPHVKRLFDRRLLPPGGHEALRRARQRLHALRRPEDRRYLLYNPMVKMKVTREGEEVMNLLHDVIAAKGFENEPFFEIAKHGLPMLCRSSRARCT